MHKTGLNPGLAYEYPPQQAMYLLLAPESPPESTMNPLQVSSGLDCHAINH